MSDEEYQSYTRPIYFHDIQKRIRESGRTVKKRIQETQEQSESDQIIDEMIDEISEWFEEYTRRKEELLSKYESLMQLQLDKVRETVEYVQSTFLRLEEVIKRFVQLNDHVLKQEQEYNKLISEQKQEWDRLRKQYEEKNARLDEKTNEVNTLVLEYNKRVHDLHLEIARFNKFVLEQRR